MLNRSLFRITLLSAVICQPVGQNAQAEEDAPLNLPPGFQATLFAGDDLAPDIQCMTTSPQGELVVSGPGYIRILNDTDDDGKADDVKVFAEAPQSGAQGLYFDGATLYCMGGEGLLAFSDEDADGKADGEPQLIRRFRVGGEHHTHAIRKGPDGYWYIIAGNDSNISGAAIESKRSPVQDPHAGVLIRLDNNFSDLEVLADGFRNAYDFDFNEYGDFFSYDSDGERDISLPWYRPTRVFHTVPGMNHGWVTRSWKKPNHFNEMTPVMVETGRGSPTGVVNYQHTQFPPEFHNTLFVLDWTYGRVMAVKTTRQGASWKAQSKEFVTGKGSFGFAPTDAVVGADGALYVSVGGRGTQGSIYRIAAKDADDTDPQKQSPLQQILNAPQPLAGWSRAKWVPLAEELGGEKILFAALNQTLTQAERLRAIEVLTEMYGGPDINFLQTMLQDTDRELRARAIWGYGRVIEGTPDPFILKQYLSDPSPLVVREALQVLGNTEEEALAGFEDEVSACLGHEDRVVRYLAVRVAARMTDASFRLLGENARNAGWPQAMQMAWAFVDRGYIGHPYAWHDIGTAVLTRHDDPANVLTAILLIQHSLGGFGDSPVHAAVFDGYLAKQPLPSDAEKLGTLQFALEEKYPTGKPIVDWEIARLIAMLSPDSPILFNKILEQMSADSDPVRDLHHLIVAACLPVSRTEEHTSLIAETLLQLHEKLEKQKATLDRNWEPRVKEMYSRLVSQDEALPKVIAAHKKFGRPEHDLFLSGMEGDVRESALARFATAVEQDEIDLTPELLRLLTEQTTEESLQLAREALQTDILRLTALVAIARANQPTDRERILEGLQEEAVEVIVASVVAIEEWTSYTPDDLAHLALAVRKVSRMQNQESLWEDTTRVLRNVAESLAAAEEGAVAELPDMLPLLDKTKPEVAEVWTNWVRDNFSRTASLLVPAESEQARNWETVFERIDWETGTADAGRLVFEKKQCAQCHEGRTSIGPNLAGIAKRFSRPDLLTAIVDPHRDVSSRYQTTMFTTMEGKTFTGLIIYESSDGLLLRDMTHRTIRLESDDVEFRKQLGQSLMPENLLKGCSDEEIADLYAYLQTLE